MTNTSPRFLFAAFMIAAAVILHPLAVRAAELPFPAGSPARDTIRFEYAIYYLPVPGKDPVKAAADTVARLGLKLKPVQQLPKTASEAVYVMRLEKDVGKNYRPLDMRALQYFGYGLSRAQAEQLQTSRQALILDFAHPQSQVWDALHAANRLVEKIARDTGGLVWDEETRQIFSPDEWRTRRIDFWTAPYADVSRHTTIHAYKNGDYVRAITLGMAKFGLPDVVIQNFSWSLNRSMGNVINLFCQTMAEGARFAKAGEYDLDLRTIKNPSVREAQVSRLKSNANSVARLSLKQGTPEEGDPSNRLVEIDFDRYPGKDLHAKQDAMLSALFGAEDGITYIRHNQELLAVSQKAKEKLPALNQAFNAGLAPGEYIQLKAPFATDDGGQEWMWVEVVEWKGQKIKGLLKNEPFKIAGLHGGQIVEIRQQDVFDFLRTYPDGKQEGNETSKIILKMKAQ